MEGGEHDGEEEGGEEEEVTSQRASVVPLEGGAAPSRDRDETEGGDCQWRRRRRRRRRSSADDRVRDDASPDPVSCCQCRPPGATGTPGGRSSDGLDDFAPSQAARADANPLGSALHDRPHRHQVGQPPLRGDVVGMADLIAHNRTLPTHITTLGHAPGLLGRDGTTAAPPGPGTEPTCRQGTHFYTMGLEVRQARHLTRPARLSWP